MPLRPLETYSHSRILKEIPALAPKRLPQHVPGRQITQKNAHYKAKSDTSLEEASSAGPLLLETHAGVQGDMHKPFPLPVFFSPSVRGDETQWAHRNNLGAAKRNRDAEPRKPAKVSEASRLRPD